MNLGKLIKIGKRALPIIITYAPVAAALVREVKKEVRKPKV